MKPRIAIIEDEPDLRENYAAALSRHGYQVCGYAERGRAADALAARPPDLVIIDVGLAGDPEGGFELCRQLRAGSATLPIIFLTARDSEIDAVSGLRLGADDYLTKDISLEHLAARVAALLRRVRAERGNADDRSRLLARGALTLDPERYTVRWRERPVGLSLTEFWIVHALARHPGHVKTRAQLMEAANVVLDDNSITAQIKRIRRKFAAVDEGFDAIETVYGMGYRWRGDDASGP